ncbi:acyltransferase [Lutibacter sp.]
MAKGNLFGRYKLVINFMVWINSILPIKLNKFLLVIFRNTPTRLGILFRYVLLKNICKGIGENVVVFEGVIFDAPEMMTMGNNVSINPYCYLAGEITIGNDVSIAHNCGFHSFNHTWEDTTLPIRKNPLYTKRIIIKSDVWIGCNSIILSGVTIGNRSVVAAGAIVLKSVSNNSLIGGNPAKLIKKI